MARTPPAGGGGAPTGNALSDSNIQAILQSTNIVVQEAQAFGSNLDQANAQLGAVASDCMWPPSAQVTIPIIPGVYSQSFQIPCLVTYSEARALVAVGLLLVGGSIFWGGLAILGAAEALPFAVNVIAGGPEARTAKKAKKAAKKTAAAPDAAAEETTAAPEAAAEETQETAETTQADVTTAA